MKPILHITSGDIAGERLANSGLAGEVFVWHDILYDGPRNPGWPADDTLSARARFLEAVTGGGLGRDFVRETLDGQYARLAAAQGNAHIVLWFDACLFDQAMLCHILACMKARGIAAELICLDSFPGVVPFNGLGQLSPAQLASVYDRRTMVTADQFLFAERVERAFAGQDRREFAALATCADPPLPWIPAAVARWLKEQPDPPTGLSLLQRLALAAMQTGCTSPAEIYAAVAANDAPPQFWGDTTLWAAINALAERQPPLARIAGPLPRLPQWHGIADLTLFRVYPAE